VRLPSTRAEDLNPSLITPFVCIIPKARAPPPVLACAHPHPSTLQEQQRTAQELPRLLSPTVDIFQPAFVRSQVYFPDKRLVQYDCGKLQQLDILLRTLKSGAHRALIFTQMTRMLDVLEVFLNIHGYTYMRLDG
jgi:SNF2 family DNA or RNA helicase